MSGVVAVWFSCGVASAVAARLACDKYGERVVILNNPVLEEDEDNARFLLDVERWLCRPIQSVVNPKYPNASAREVWAKRRFMSGRLGAPCTLELKKEARRAWETKNNPEIHVMGFTFEEKRRFERFRLTERSNVEAPLIDSGLTKEDCHKIIRSAGIDPPRIYGLGYPNANCIGCVKATSPDYWNLVRKHHPHVFDDRARQSREIGCRLARYKGVRVFLDELPDDAADGQMEMSFDCGIFCEEGDR